MYDKVRLYHTRNNMIDYTEGSGKQYHIGVGKEDIGEYVILPGDPGRCEKNS